ncbi:hypothetical protein CCL08_01690 [Pseudomonas congelans]|uniref:ImmA/IrrE family metallo-endopeptidase n=1 Tax=Pseudomonas congelans TaxID=200452 RepID=UPI000BB8FB4D|nr:ImmA/IrrE family metallo-endopeptidase [Pseudomonas congelans]PBQ22009.1 hypothetical protein CCL08_01690 [Pseudomonas congelans]
MTESMQSLYSALRQQGLPKNQVRSLMPSWWHDDIADTAGGLQQAKFILARAFNLKLRSIAETPARIEFDLPEQRRFKLIKGTTAEDVTLAVALARSASKVTLANIDVPYTRPGSASEIRAQILASGKRWVGLDELLAYCWSCGIPVIHLATPLMRRKMDGIAMSTKGRPTIVLSSKKECGYLLFHLAHELGHIALGHLDDNGAIVDTEIAKSSSGKEPDEVDADNYALELLAGRSGAKLRLSRPMSAPSLAQVVSNYGVVNGIDPTHVVLNCAHNGNYWGLCTNTLKLLASEMPDQKIVTSYLFRNLAEEIKEDSLELLRTLVDPE